MFGRIKVLVACLSMCGLAAGLSASSVPTGVGSAGRSHNYVNVVQRKALAHLLATAPNKPFPNRGATVNGGVTNVFSPNWSGYAATSATDQFFTRASGSWTVPKIDCTTEEDQQMIAWVGLDGLDNNTVEQIGTASVCVQDTSIYFTWYEMFPSALMVVGTTIAPEDTINASVARTGTSYTLKLTDPTSSGNNIDTMQTCSLTSCLDTSAELIAERPQFACCGFTPLARFDIPVAFSAASVSGGGSTGPFTAFSYDKVNMLDATESYLLAGPGALNTAGSAFKDTWRDSW